MVCVHSTCKDGNRKGKTPFLTEKLKYFMKSEISSKRMDGLSFVSPYSIIGGRNPFIILAAYKKTQCGIRLNIHFLVFGVQL